MKLKDVCRKIKIHTKHVKFYDSSQTVEEVIQQVIDEICDKESEIDPHLHWYYFEWKYLLRHELYDFDDFISKEDWWQFYEIISLLEFEIGKKYTEFHERLKFEVKEFKKERCDWN